MKMVFNPRGRLLFTIVALTILLWQTSADLAAHENSEILTGVDVAGATAKSARAGEDTTVHFALENLSGTDLMLVGARSEVASTGALVLSVPGLPPEDVDVFMILDQESLDFGSSHIRVELRGLQQDLLDGNVTSMELLFRQGIVPLRLDVHDQDIQ